MGWHYEVNVLEVRWKKRMREATERGFRNEGRHIKKMMDGSIASGSLYCYSLPTYYLFESPWMKASVNSKYCFDHVLVDK